jgi:isochorismate synthase EntC
MTVIARDFIRRFSHFKRHAQAGKALTVTDRKGHVFSFVAKKPSQLIGSGRRFYKGAPVTSDSVPKDEWKGLV